MSNSEFDGFVKNGRKRLAQIAAATGVTQLNDSQQLHDIPMTIVLGIEVDKNGVYDDKNVIKKVMPLKGGAPSKFTAKPQVPSAPQAPEQPAAAPQQPQADATPAWQRG